MSYFKTQIKSYTKSCDRKKTKGDEGVISETKYNYTTLTTANKKFINVVKDKREENLLKGTFATQTITYDAFYNPVKITENFTN